MTRTRLLPALIITGILFLLSLCLAFQASADQYGIGKGNIYSVPTLTTFYLATSITGTTGETTLGTVNVPGGKLGTHGKLRFTSWWTHTNSANTKTLKIYFGSVLVGFANAAATQGTSWIGVISNKGAFNQNNYFTALGLSGGALTTLNVDTASDKLLTFTCALANIADTCGPITYTIEIMR